MISRAATTRQGCAHLKAGILKNGHDGIAEMKSARLNDLLDGDNDPKAMIYALQSNRVMKHNALGPSALTCKCRRYMVRRRQGCHEGSLPQFTEYGKSLAVC